MHFVYALNSEKFDKIYVGFSEDHEKRLAGHNDHRNKGWTKSYQPWKMILQEEWSSKTEALKREKQLKSSRGRSFVRSLVDSE